ncbi:MAG: ABC transporter ATP-binding protein [Myxococcota bacterium]
MRSPLLARLRRTVGGLVRVSWSTAPALTAAYFTVAVVAGLGPVVVVVALRFLIDALDTSARAGRIGLAVLGWLAARQAASFVAGFLRGVVLNTVLDTFLRYRLQMALTLRLADKLVHLDQPLREDDHVQELVARTRETYLWRTVSLVHNTGGLVLGAVAWGAALAWLVGFAPWVPPLLLAIAVPRLWLRARTGAVHYSMYGAGAPDIRKLYYLQHLLTGLDAGAELRVLRAGRALLARLDALQQDLFHRNTAAMREAFRIEWLPPLGEGVVLMLLALWVLPQVGDGTRTVGQLVLFLGLCEQFASATTEAVGRIGLLLEDSLFAQDLFDVLALPRAVPERRDPIPLPVADGPPRIELDEVSFAYPGGPPILDRVSLVLTPGEAVALVGENGAGKSTLVKLLLRLYDPTGGSIRVDGVDLRDVALDDWYGRVGVLFQRFVDLQLTVRDGIALGDPAPDDARVQRAAAVARADGIVAALPGGYDAVVGKRYAPGQELSWGQWQRLALARAVYGRRPVLILDEPTSAVDAQAEAAIFDGLRDELGGHTLLFVSHRFSTVRRASRVVVLAGGRVAEEGTHEALVAAGGRYAAMFEAQARGYR